MNYHKKPTAYNVSFRLPHKPMMIISFMLPTLLGLLAGCFSVKGENTLHNLSEVDLNEKTN
ncbi:hypothetical protein H1230_15405 [Paenibacillus sp. 19GGS1-52]|uniref:hypothetical protein n=1 Tax=Paenibacillus sp. 19GGS1-52 TaxID=2758563 RepID=UPI001EFB7443|nr:hypothetical protein [Paenibacillus sp. 19GGS1-52]ULO10030.1 hypothetical protein H1230_15405 [Paenibacillus sp. 19GGS1-52]